MISFQIFIVFFLWGAVLTPLSIQLSGRFGLIDQPDPRKIHSDPVPRGAGLILWTGFLFWALTFSTNTLLLRMTVTGATLVFFAGYIDDMQSLPPLVRLAVHFVAAALVVIALKIRAPFQIVLYLFWIAGTTNAYNLIDGMNGLALTMAALALGAVEIYNGGGIAIPAAAIILGILPWNFPVAKTFVGDGGVYLLGYLVSSLVTASLNPQKLPLLVQLFAMLLFGGVPVIDTLIAILRRLSSGRSPFAPDRGHIHHRLMDRGVNCHWALLILSLLQCLSLWCALMLVR